MTGTTATRKVSVLLALSATSTLLVSAEQAPKELPWSAEKCTQLGYADSRFDECAEIEFCEGYVYGGDGYRHNRQLRGMQSAEMYGEGENEGEVENWNEQTYYDENGNVITENVEGFVEDSNVGGGGGVALRPASFGWRIPGGECSWPGPLIRMSRGKTYGLFVRGSGSEETITNIHTHGLHIPGHGNADDVTRSVSGSDVIIYEYHIPSYHMGGTHWYHSHWHHNSEQQVGGGAFGMLIVDDGENVMEGGGVDAGVEAFLSNEKILIASNHEDIYGSWIVNGVQDGRETYDFAMDEWYRLRILTVNLDDHRSTRTITFGDECEAYAIAHDGIFRFKVPAATPQSTFSMGDASRLDVAIRCSSDSTVSINDEIVASIKASSNTNSLPSPFTSSGEAWFSTRPEYLVDLRDIQTDGGFSIKLDETNINGEHYSLEKPLCGGGSDFQFGTTQEWTLSLSYHPFHLHIYPMQVVSEDGACGDNHEYGEFYDTITISHSDYSKRKSKCKVRLAFKDVGGKTLMQCHVMKHGDQGSMAFIQVVGGPVQDDKPRVHECAYEPCDEPVIVPTCEGGDTVNY